MANTQTSIKFFDYQHFIEKESFKRVRVSDPLQLINKALNDENIVANLHKALIEWASHFRCVEVVFWGGSNAFSQDLTDFLRQGPNKISFQDFQKVVLNDLSSFCFDVSEDKKLFQESVRLKCVLDLNFPAFLMSFLGKSVLFLSVKNLAKNGSADSSVNLLKETQERLAAQVKRLDQMLEIGTTLFTVDGDLSIHLKEHFFSHKTWAKIPTDSLLNLIKTIGQFYEDLHKAALFKDWTIECRLLKNPIEDFLICFQSKDISFLGALLQFFFCAFSTLLSNCVNSCLDKQEFSKAILQNVKLKIRFQNRSSSLLGCNESFDSRFQMVVFSSAIRSAIFHDAVVVLSAGGFYLDLSCVNEESKKKLGFSRFLESIFKAITNHKEVNFIVPKEEKSTQENHFITVSSQGICIQNASLFVSLNTYLAIILESIAQKLVFILDVLNDELLQKNEKLSLKLLEKILRDQIFSSALNCKCCDLRNLSALKMSDLLSDSLVFQGLFSRSRAELIQNCIMEKYADFYRQLLLLGMKDVEGLLQEGKLKNSSEKTLEQLLDKIKCFYTETKDLHSEAMIFAFGKVGRELLNQVQIKLVGEKNN